MVYNQRDFRKDKPKPLKLRTVCGLKILTIFPKEKMMKTTKMVVILILALGLTTEVANADFTFGTPVNLGPTVNSSYGDIAPNISADGLELFFYSPRPGGYGGYDIWVTMRASVSDPWAEPLNLGPTVNSWSRDAHPCVSADGLSLFFESTRPGGYGGQDLWVTIRATTNDDWGIPVNLGPTVNSSAVDDGASISADGLSLFFDSNRAGGYGYWDVWVTRRATTSDPWGPPVNLGPTINTSRDDLDQTISPDGLSLFFCSDRTGDFDLWLSSRPSRSDLWGPAVNLGPVVNSSADDWTPDISSDGFTLYFCSNRPDGVGSYDILQASIVPVVDFNGDGKVDVKDVVIMTEHWGENFSLCDIGPTPLGDGIVDVQDLVVLTEYMEPKDRTLIAHWALDEAEGIIAQDSSAGDNDAYVIGGPLWQPSGGQVDGALQLDGIDDYVSTPFILDPAKDSLSVFAWIKGGAPGQVIISQTGGFGGTWLGTNPLEGKLMTGLSDAYFGALDSESVITDGQWYHVGLVYDLDALHRHLYVDGVEVAVDSDYVAGVPSNGGLCIGAAKDLDAGSFWSGLIDDVRIYNRAVKP